MSTQANSFFPTLNSEPSNLTCQITEEEIKKILNKYKWKLKNQPSDKKEIILLEDCKKVSLILDKRQQENVKHMFVAQSEKSTPENPTYCFHLLCYDGKIQPISIKYCFDNLQKKLIYQQTTAKKGRYEEETKTIEKDLRNIKFHEDIIEKIRSDLEKEACNPEKITILKEKLLISQQQLEVFKISQDKIDKSLGSHKEITIRMEIEFARLKSGFPVYAMKFEIMNHIKTNKISLIYGETGCGKSTQIPQYITEELHEFFGNKPIIVTQPRKIAVKTLADRVIKEQKQKLNQNSRIISQTGLIKPAYNEKQIGIKFMLDRALLDEYAEDRNLSKYGCIIVDEAHERNVNTDVLLGFLLQLTLKRTDNFRVVIMSATMDDALFERYFKAPIYIIPGKLYPVMIKYYPCKDKSSALETIENLIKTEIFDKSRRLKSEYDGHILIFTSGLEDIRLLYRKLLGWVNSKFYHLFQLHGKIAAEQQEAIYEDYDSTVRKIILATRIAESSITINKVKVVIDIGYDLQQVYDKAKKITKIELHKTTQSQCIQRKGRAGRTTSGYCFRIYSEEDYEKMNKFKESEILHINSDLVVLKLKQLGVKDVRNFDYLEPPSADSLNSSLIYMEEIGAFDEKNENLSKLGELMARLPTEPALSRIIIEGKNQGCYEQVIKIVAMMIYGANLFTRKISEKESQDTDLLKTEFYDKSSDLIIFLKVYENWMKFGNDWCEKNGINIKSLILAKELSEEIDIVLRSYNADIKIYLETHGDNKKANEEINKKIIKCFLSSMYDNICIYTKNTKIGYMLLGRNMIIKMDESSTFSMQAIYPKWLLASEFFQNDNGGSCFYARILSEIDLEMIESMVPKSFLDRYKLQYLNQLECPIYQMKRLENIPSRILSVFINKKTNEVVNLFQNHEETYFEFISDKNYLEIWTLKDMDIIEKTIEIIIQNLLEASKKESIEYKWMGDTRLVLEKGVEVKRVLFSGEFRNMVFSFLNINSNTLPIF